MAKGTKSDFLQAPTISKLSEMKVQKIRTGIPEVDMVLGGGVRQKCVTQFVGQPGSGKSTIAYHLMKEAQDMGLKAAYLDVEGKADRTYIETIGVNPDDILYVEGATTAEQYLDVVMQLALSDKPGEHADLIVYDSIVAAGAQQEVLNKNGSVREMSDATIAALPRVLSAFFRNRWGLIRSRGTTLVCVNQVRAQGLGTVFVTEGASGGNALAHITEDELFVKKVSSSPALKWMYGAERAMGHGIKLAMKKAGSGGIQARNIDSQFVYLNAPLPAPEYDIASNLTLTYFGVQSGIITGRYTLPTGESVKSKNDLYQLVCDREDIQKILTDAFIKSGGLSDNVDPSEEEEETEEIIDVFSESDDESN